MTKLLLINASDKRYVSQTVFWPLGLAYIAAYVRKHLPKVEIRIIADGIYRNIKEFEPDLVGISAVSQNFNMVKEIAALCRQLGIVVFVGGMHISMLPESLPQTVDFAILGEGEQTMCEVLRLFEDCRADFLKNLGRIKGVAFYEQGAGLNITPKRELIAPLDNIPFPARDLLNVQKGGFMYLFSSRGCPYRCRFCASSRFWQRVRYFSAEYVFNELQQVLEKYRPRAITFYDDDFIAERARFRKLVAMIKEAGIDKRTEFNIMSRVESIDRETVELMKSVNVTVVSLGLESGCQKTIDYLKRGKVTVDQNERAIELLAGANILTYGFFIIGSPDETEQEILQTLDFIRKSRLSGFSVYSLTPYPGTPVWDYCRQNSLVSDDMNWARLALNISEARNGVIVLSKVVSAQRLYEIYGLFQRERRKRHLSFMIRRGLKNPGLLIPRIKRSLKHYLKNR